MQAFFVNSDLEDGMYGPYTDRVLGERILKIVRMAIDEEAELQIVETDMFGAQIRAGMLPFKVCVVLLAEKVQSVEVVLCWPPETEGVLVEREDYREYFVWAGSQSEAKARLAGLPRRPPACCESEPVGGMQ
jgi:hypothetical protein